MRRIGGVLGAIAASVVIAGCGANAEDAPATVHIPQPLPATPMGITLVNVSQIIGVAPPDYLWTRLGDAEGRTLFVSAADKPDASSCEGECAKDFPPVLADVGAVGFGDWSLAKRSGGAQQWAYKHRPLYTFAKETRVNQVVDTMLAKEQEQTGGGNRRRRPPSDALTPPDGWSVVKFEPEKGLVLPSAVTVKTMAVQDGMGDALVTSQGMTLYGFDGAPRDAAKASCAKSSSGDTRCSATFKPYLAPETASAVGDFSIARVDGHGEAGQWAYKGVPLYTFSGDNKSMDTFGVYGDHGPWHVIFLYLDAFPEAVQAIHSVGHDKVLADAEGHPLYARAHFRPIFGGVTAYHDYMAPYYMGAAIRSGGCDADCQKVRRPLLAPADARSKGDWMVYTRDDGTKQWAFQGFALWSYTADKPGFVNGHNVTDYIIGDEGTYKIADATAGEPGGQGGMGAGSFGVGLFWYVTHPDWLGR